jgi:SAM-dependent methyltransferase
MNMKISKKTRALLNKRKVTVCDLGCGGAKQSKDWFGVDYRALPGVDLVQDLEAPMWNIPSESFNTIICSHVVEHINPAHGGFINFMNSAWRILKPGGEFLIACPYATSTGMFRDPTHCNFVNEETWSYFDPNDDMYKGSLYGIYSPLPFKIKVNTWNSDGSLEVVLVKREITKEMNVDPEYLKILKEQTRLTK